MRPSKLVFGCNGTAVPEFYWIPDEGVRPSIFHFFKKDQLFCNTLDPGTTLLGICRVDGHEAPCFYGIANSSIFEFERRLRLVVTRQLMDLGVCKELWEKFGDRGVQGGLVFESIGVGSDRVRGAATFNGLSDRHCSLFILATVTGCPIPE